MPVFSSHFIPPPIFVFHWFPRFNAFRKFPAEKKPQQQKYSLSLTTDQVYIHRYLKYGIISVEFPCLYSFQTVQSTHHLPFHLTLIQRQATCNPTSPELMGGGGGGGGGWGEGGSQGFDPSVSPSRASLTQQLLSLSQPCCSQHCFSPKELRLGCTQGLGHMPRFGVYTRGWGIYPGLRCTCKFMV